MVIHQESESPVELAVARKPTMEPKSYLMIKNHIRELPIVTNSPSNSYNANEEVLQPVENAPRNRNNNLSTMSKKRKLESRNSCSEEEISYQISESDLSKLREVYHNCLAVINKMESKYGHLLNEENHSLSGIGLSNTGTDLNTCTCIKNKRILFDADGTQYMKEVAVQNHICQIKTPGSASVQKCNVESDSEDYSLSLPDDLPTLAKMLHNLQLNLNHRNKIIHKIKSLKQEHSNEIRFNRPALIQSIKQDSDQVLGFKGVNLSTLPGYP